MDWIAYFLIGRVVRVSVLDIRSSFMNVRNGVPQGSVLRPLFFVSSFTICQSSEVIFEYTINIVDMSSDL